MIYNYLSETDLQGHLFEKEYYKWTGQSDLSTPKSNAEQTVLLDFINSKYRLFALRPDLNLRSSTDTIAASSTGTSYEDTGNRLRLAYNVTVRTGTTALVLQGSNDEATWTTITTQSITDTGAGSFVFVSAYKYYRINSTISAGTLAFTAWLTETIFDKFFLYKWLEFILMGAGKADPESKFTNYALYFREMYKELWEKGIFQIDNDGDGTTDEESSNSDVRFGR